jgi:hypothetical protein
MNNISRRGLLVGGGALGLGAALVPGNWVLAEGTGNDAPSEPTNQGAVLSLVVTPGLSYVGMSGYALQSRDGANAVTDTTWGAGPRPGGAVCNMDIAVPHGALMTEFYLSGTGATNVLFRRQRFGVYAHETIVSATTPGPPGTLQEIKVAIDPPVIHDATTECLLFRTDLSNVQAVSSMAIGFTPATVALIPLASPKRVYDSRAAEPPANVVKGVLGGGVDRDVDVKNNGSGVPATARAVVGNVTLTNTSGSGYVDIRPAGTAWANTSTINFSASGQTVANGFTATLGPNATVTVRCGPAGPASTDFVIDVLGYYV